MYAEALITIRCDMPGCESKIEQATELTATSVVGQNMNRRMKEAGWEVTPSYQAHTFPSHYCPKCVAEAAAEFQDGDAKVTMTDN